MLCFVVHAKHLPDCTEKTPEAQLKVDSVFPLLLLFSEKKAVFILLSPLQVLSINSALLFLPVVALCKLLAGNRRSRGCESPIDFGKRRVFTALPLRSHSERFFFVAPSTNVLWSLFSSHHDSVPFHLDTCPVWEIAVDCLCRHWCDPLQQMLFGHLLIRTQAAEETAVWCCKLTRIISH